MVIRGPDINDFIPVGYTNNRSRIDQAQDLRIRLVRIAAIERRCSAVRREIETYQRTDTRILAITSHG